MPLSALPNLIPKNGGAYYWQNFLSNHSANFLFQRMQNEISWQQVPIKLFGKAILQPRLTVWFADSGVKYSYSGLRLGENPFPPYLEELRILVNNSTSQHFNSALLNYYRSGQDSMGWHQDDESELGKNPVIASFTLGAVRNFQMRHINEPELKVQIPLQHGSLLVMAGECQHFWKHSIQKSKKISEPRINITFRQVLT